jgi:hypothetical protein
MAGEKVAEERERIEQSRGRRKSDSEVGDAGQRRKRSGSVTFLRIDLTHLKRS